MNRAQSPSKLPTLLCEVEDYYSSGSCSPSLKQALQSKIESESSSTIVISVMTIGTNNLEEMAAMNAMLERHIKESEEKEVRIKLQEEKIAMLTRMLEKRPT